MADIWSIENVRAIISHVVKRAETKSKKGRKRIITKVERDEQELYKNLITSIAAMLQAVNRLDVYGRQLTNEN